MVPKRISETSEGGYHYPYSSVHIGDKGWGEVLVMRPGEDQGRARESHEEDAHETKQSIRSLDLTLSKKDSESMQARANNELSLGEPGEQIVHERRRVSLACCSSLWSRAVAAAVWSHPILSGLHRERRSHASMQPSESAQQATEETFKEFIKEGLQGEIETSCLVQTEAERIWIRCDGNKSQPILLDKSNTRVINGDGCEFLLSCGEAKYVLRAESVKTKLEWLNALQKHYLLADTESVSSQESVFLPPPFPRRHFSHRMSSETRTEALEISFPATSKTSTIKLVSVMRSFNIDGMITNHHLAGIGIKFTYLPSRKLYQIVDIDVLSSAAGKLKIGDVLFAVDGKPIKEKLPHEITALIVGLRGSAVTLGVSRLQSSARDAKEQEMMSKARRLYDRGVELCHARLYDEAIIQLQQAEDLWANDCDDLLAASAAYRARVSAMRRRLTQGKTRRVAV
eukprot:759889-Hanusia_phi.AAC.1